MNYTNFVCSIHHGQEFVYATKLLLEYFTNVKYTRTSTKEGGIKTLYYYKSEIRLPKKAQPIIWDNMA